MDVRHLIGIALAAGASALLAEDAAIAVAPDFAFSIDTCGGTALVKSLDAVALPYGVAQKVTATGEGSATTVTLVESAAGTGEYAWTPSSGGVWTLTNSVEGVARFLVRYSLFPEMQGAGTVDDPAKIVDDGEIPERIAAGSVAYGYVVLLGGEASAASLELPAGWSLQGVANNTYRLIAASGDMLYESAGIPFMVDSRGAGPNRRWPLGKPVEVAYSGDNWIGGPGAQSTLAITTPSGGTTELPLSGTGLHGFTPAERGVYTLTLATDDASIVSKVTVLSDPFVLIVR
ncbi:MAG: hypothetical protein IKO55_13315 [Kiritimatiellae bacterium]|nr:hypothetical protein [Kiritimatiellia bacterium]